MEKAEDIQFHPWNTTYIFTAVKYSFLYFHGCKYSFFKKYILFNQYFPVFHYFVYNKVICLMDEWNVLNDIMP